MTSPLGPLLTVQRETAPPRPQPQPRPQFTTEPVTRAWQLRSHLQRLIDGGFTHDAIYARSGYRLSKHSIDAILSGAGTFSLLTETAERVLAIEVPPNT